MNNNSKIVLKYLHRYSNYYQSFDRFELMRNCDIHNIDEINDILNYLIDKKYISYKTTDDNELSVKSNKQYFCTLIGKDYCKNVSNEYLKILFINIIFPLVVAFLTARITSIDITNDVINSNECCEQSTNYTENDGSK